MHCFPLSQFKDQTLNSRSLSLGAWRGWSCSDGAATSAGGHVRGSRLPVPVPVPALACAPVPVQVLLLLLILLLVRVAAVVVVLLVLLVLPTHTTTTTTTTTAQVSLVMICAPGCRPSRTERLDGGAPVNEKDARPAFESFGFRGLGFRV